MRAVKHILPVLALGLAGILSACMGGYGTGPGSGSNPSVAVRTINVDYLAQHWANSYEEEVDPNIRIYRAVDFAQLPASRFRMEYIFRPDYTCDWLYLDPADAHHLRPGTWKADQDMLYIDQDGTTVKYRVLELTPAILRVEQLP